MKKLILSLIVVAFAFASMGQAVVMGVSPSSVQVNFDFGVQVDAGGWPGEIENGTWGFDGSGINFNTPGVYIQDTLMLVEDGTPGMNDQGNPISQEGCNELINDLTGKIAVVYRNTCYFSAKVFYAQEAGAEAVIIINREDALVAMAPNTDPVNGPLGTECTIPAVFLSSPDGALLTTAMENGPVVMFIGNKFGAFVNDAGSTSGDVLSPKYGSIPQSMANNNYSFQAGLQLVNYGSADNQVEITASLDGPSGNLYSNMVTAFMVSGDTLAVFNGNPIEFPSVSTANWEIGEYTMTYSIDIPGVGDDLPFDNTFERKFNVTADVLSYATQDDGGVEVRVNSYPTNSDELYKSCVFLEEVYPTTTTGIEGVYFSPNTIDDSTFDQEITFEVFEWNDTWAGISEINYGTGTGTSFLDLVQVGNGAIYLTNQLDDEAVVYVAFSDPILLSDNQRYLVCGYTFNGDNVSFGYDNTNNFDANQSIYDRPINPLQITQGNDVNRWWSGWSGGSVPSFGLKVVPNVSVAHLIHVDGSAYPNPASNQVTIEVDGEGSAILVVSDISGKVAFSNQVNLVDGKSAVDISNLDSGVYMFNVTLENGNTSTFSVVKK